MSASASSTPRLRLGAIAAAALAVGLAAWVHLRASEAPDGDGASAAGRQAVRVLDATTLELSPEELAELGTVRALTRDFPETLGLQGSISVVENLVTVVPCRVNNGRVDQVLRVTGDIVRAGDPLALIYSPDYVSAREEYLQILGGNGAVDGGLPPDLGDFAAMARKKLELMGLTAKDIAALPQAKDEHLVVRAIRDGAIISVNTMTGNLQNLGDTLFTTADLRRVWFSGDLYLEDLPRVRQGQTIIIGAEGISRPLTGRISFISPVLDPNVHTVKVRALIANPRHALLPSMFVQAKIVLSHGRALVLPLAAVLRMNGKAFCFRQEGASRFQEVPVRLGRSEGGVVSIAGGLAQGDTVLADGLDSLDRALDAARPSE